MVKRDDEHKRAKKNHEIKLTEAGARGDHDDDGGGVGGAGLRRVPNP